MRQKKQRRPADNGSFWISYSDMMAGMLFTFALILFMSVYQLVDLQQRKTIELETKEAQLSTQQSILLDQEAALKDQEQLLATTTLLLQEQQEELDKNRSALTAAQESLALQQGKIEEQAALLAAQQTEIDKLIGLRSRIIEDLRDELHEQGLDASVDKNTGAIAFTGAVLFDSNQNTIKDSGKELLNAFIPVYVRTLMSEENEGFVGEIIIEGHTDPDGSYLHNLALSQERALAVAQYCFGPEMTSMTATEKLMLQSILTANGRSYSDPVYKSDGMTVDKEASRRVVFKFRMKDTDMIDQMSEIIEAQGID
ncbi:MAG: OmpA family protein [Clostridia bacterium]|nr:OmpA family protein [Clostridia bacterium]